MQTKDFKKKVVFQNQEIISFISSEDAVEQYIDILFRDNGKEGSSPAVITTLMEITKFTKIMSQILSNSPKFTVFVNSFFNTFQSHQQLPVLCSILKEIILKICDENVSPFLNNINGFLDEITNFTHIFAIMELFTTLVIYHSDFYSFTEQINERLFNKITNEDSLFDYLQMAERVVSQASSPRRFNQEILGVFKPEVFVKIVRESESTNNKVIALNILGKLRISEEKMEEIVPELVECMENTTGIVQGKLIEFTKTIPSNYISLIIDPHTHCTVKQQIINNASEITNVTEEDITTLKQNLRSQENKTNPFIADLLEILLKRNEVSSHERLMKEVEERKNKRVMEYGVSVQRQIRIAPSLMMRRAINTLPFAIEGFIKLNSNTYVIDV